MNTVLLAVIALAVVVIAIVQVAWVVTAARTAKRFGDVAERLERDIRPIVGNLQSITTDAARTAATAAATVERADRFVHDAARRVEQAIAGLPSLIDSAREGMNVVAMLKSVIATFRSGARRRPSASEEEDALFIG